MKIKKSFICFTILSFLLTNSIFGFEAVPTSDLLMSYLENDNDLKKNAIDAQKAQLSLDSTNISNGFDVTLSTGNITIKTDGSGTSVSVSPSVKASLPQASNLGVSVSSNYTYKNNNSTIQDTSISASVDLISTAGISREITILKAERTLTEAIRKLRNQAINTEKAFYTELKSLLNSTSSLINLEKTLYTNKTDFEKIKAQGYSTNSSTYRLAQMKVISTEHDIESSTRSLINSYVLFYKRCGYDITVDSDIDFYELIPSDITAIEPIDIHSFDADSYSEVESVLWTNKINAMQRKTKSSFSLSANGGVTINNSNTSTNTIDAGINSQIGGVTLGAGINVPIGSSFTPAITLSASLQPNKFRQNAITEKTNLLDEQEELINLETARANYENKITECEQTLENLQWNAKSDQESYEMYAALEKDLSSWYKQGIITESEYLSAKVNAQSYSVKNIINAIDFIIYNDNIVTMFVEENQEN